jgi:hypothetical protein
MKGLEGRTDKGITDEVMQTDEEEISSSTSAR